MVTLQMHIEAWKNCTRCEYSEKRNKTVLGRGDIPCDILLIGEAPGPSENMLGVPFIGKAGKILDRIVQKVFGPVNSRKYRIAFNNIVACIPLVGEGHEKEEPDSQCVEACQPRLEEFLHIANPRMLVFVGKTAAEWFDPYYKYCIKTPRPIPRCSILHPAHILRMPVSAQTLAEHQCAVIISTAVQQHLESDNPPESIVTSDDIPF